MDRRMERVVPLEELRDDQVAPGEPDVRGWEVIAGDGTRLGEVDDLLVDRKAGEVRFLDVTVDEELVGDCDTTQHLLVPVGSARLDEEEDQVFVDGLTSTGIFPGGEERDREDPDEGRQDEQQAGAAPLVDRDRAIVELEPSQHSREREEMRDPSPDRS
jgi:sporulation protein YlmC with PRC-barrel domain